jgi:hypothetical protein
VAKRVDLAAKVPPANLLQADLRGELEQDGVRRLVETVITKVIPKSVRNSDFLSIGPRKELNSGRWINIRDYTWARANEHEKEFMNKVVDNVARISVSLVGGGMFPLRA